MKAVGDHLAIVAAFSVDVGDTNRFGRSAFNRYYYATFLEVRKTFREIGAVSGSLHHGQVPKLLRRDVRDRVKRELEKSQPVEADGIRRLVEAVTDELANLMAEAYEVRRLADYEPNVPVISNGSELTLGRTTLADAREWPDRATLLLNSLLQLYRNLGLLPV